MPTTTLEKVTGHGRGFASMDAEKRRALARKGGLRAQELGKAYKWTPETAKAAGRAGGLKSRKRPKVEVNS
jgi:uncharacterized protein